MLRYKYSLLSKFEESSLYVKKECMLEINNTIRYLGMQVYTVRERLLDLLLFSSVTFLNFSNFYVPSFQHFTQVCTSTYGYILYTNSNF